MATMTGNTAYQAALAKLDDHSYLWCLTGVAGFIGSNILEVLLRHNQRVIGIDNLSTGFKYNLTAVRRAVSKDAWLNFKFFKGDIADPEICKTAIYGVDYVLHQAAMGSVPRSIKYPVRYNDTNVNGFINVISAAKDASVDRFVYASSSSVYGDSEELPKVEANTGKPLSPYAATKCINELYADVFARVYGLPTMGLRYFNVFGPRQNPKGAYAAVIPKWIAAIINGEEAAIYGDGATSRDFCFIDNVVQANIIAALTDNPAAINQVYNIAVGNRTTLNELHALIQKICRQYLPELKDKEVSYQPFRDGDIRHSHANIDKAKKLLGYLPEYVISEGLDKTIKWHV